MAVVAKHRVIAIIALCRARIGFAGKLIYNKQSVHFMDKCGVVENSMPYSFPESVRRSGARHRKTRAVGLPFGGISKNSRI